MTNRQFSRFIFALIFTLFFLVSCRGDDPIIADPNSFVVTADRDLVFTIVDGDKQPLDSPEEATLKTGDGVDVNSDGRAIINFADLLTVEVLRDGELTVQEVAIDEQSAVITILQNGGTFINDFDPSDEIEKRFTINSEFAEISATGTRFITVNEPDNSLEWIYALDATANDLMVTGPDGTTKAVETGIARWISPIGEPSAGIPTDLAAIESWLNDVSQGPTGDDPLPNFMELVWKPADTIASTEGLNELPPIGETFELGGVALVLEPGGDFTFEDCNGDGIQDIATGKNGIMSMDFRNLLNSVNALDITVIRRSRSAFGGLSVFDPARELIDNKVGAWPSGDFEILSVRTSTLIHFAEISLTNSCFLGFSLTPPDDFGDPSPPVPAVNTTEPFVSIDTPVDGDSTIINGFLLEGRASVPFERNLTLIVRSIEGVEIQRDGIFVEGGEPGGQPGTFSHELFVDAFLPADIIIEVATFSAEDGTTIATDAIILRPLSPGEGDTLVLARPPENGEFFAPYVPDYMDTITIDGLPGDWIDLSELSGYGPTPVESIVFDDLCSFATPSGPTVDLSATAEFAWDEALLYIMFIVEDEAYYPYRETDEFIFLGDAPQLILDLGLAADFSDTKANGDDIEFDFFPGFLDGTELFTPRAAIFALDSLTGDPFFDLFIGSAKTDTGYTLEAAIPWEVLRVTPEPGMVFGAAASVSDNDFSEENIQQCMVSSAPGRDFRDPTTWGTLFLLLAER